MSIGPFKEDIIEISEQRFENILTKRLKEFKKEFIAELNPKFDAIDTRFEAMESKLESRFDAIDTRFEAIDTKLDAMGTNLEARFDAKLSKTTVKIILWNIATMISLSAVIIAVLKFFAK